MHGHVMVMVMVMVMVIECDENNRNIFPIILYIKLQAVYDMMLKNVYCSGKKIHFPNCCHGYEDIHVGKDKIGIFRNMISQQRIFLIKV